MATQPEPILKCPNPKCGRKSIYHRIDGTIRCTVCGYDSAKIAGAQK